MAPRRFRASLLLSFGPRVFCSRPSLSHRFILLHDCSPRVAFPCFLQLFCELTLALQKANTASHLPQSTHYTSISVYLGKRQYSLHILSQSYYLAMSRQSRHSFAVLHIVLPIKYPKRSCEPTSVANVPIPFNILSKTYHQKPPRVHSDRAHGIMMPEAQCPTSRSVSHPALSRSGAAFVIPTWLLASSDSSTPP